MFCWPVLPTADEFLTSDECFLCQIFTETKPKSIGKFAFCLMLPVCEIGNQWGTDAVDWKMSQGCGSLASTGAMSLLLWAVPSLIPCPLLSSAHSHPAQYPQCSPPAQGRAGWAPGSTGSSCPSRDSRTSSPLLPAIPACGIKGDALEQRSRNHFSGLMSVETFPAYPFPGNIRVYLNMFWAEPVRGSREFRPWGA